MVLICYIVVFFLKLQVPGCLSGPLSGLPPKELQPVLFNSPRQEEQRGSYLQRSPRDRAIIDSIIAGLEVTIKP